MYNYMRTSLRIYFAHSCFLRYFKVHLDLKEESLNVLCEYKCLKNQKANKRIRKGCCFALFLRDTGVVRPTS